MTSIDFAHERETPGSVSGVYPYRYSLSLVFFAGHDRYPPDSGTPTFDSSRPPGNYLSVQWCSETDFLVSILERLFALSLVFFPAAL